MTMNARPKTALWIAPLTLLAMATADAGELRATVRNVKPNQGKLMVALYDNAAAFKADAPSAGQIVAASGSELVVIFADLPAGRYGLAAYQDTDGNGSLGANLLGIPTEPYGFSRSARASYGPPSFEDFAVTVDAAGTAVTDIRMTD